MPHALSHINFFSFLFPSSKKNRTSTLYEGNIIYCIFFHAEQKKVADEVKLSNWDKDMRVYCYPKENKNEILNKIIIVFSAQQKKYCAEIKKIFQL